MNMPYNAALMELRFGLILKNTKEYIKFQILAELKVYLDISRLKNQLNYCQKK